MRALDQAPLIKDLNIEKRFCNLKNFNEGCNSDDDDDDDDDKNNNIGQRQEVTYHRRTITCTYTANFTSGFFKCGAKISSSYTKSS